LHALVSRASCVVRQPLPQIVGVDPERRMLQQASCPCLRGQLPSLNCGTLCLERTHLRESIPSNNDTGSPLRRSGLEDEFG